MPFGCLGVCWGILRTGGYHHAAYALGQLLQNKPAAWCWGTARTMSGNMGKQAEPVCVFPFAGLSARRRCCWRTPASSCAPSSTSWATPNLQPWQQLLRPQRNATSP